MGKGEDKIEQNILGFLINNFIFLIEKCHERARRGGLVDTKAPAFGCPHSGWAAHNHLDVTPAPLKAWFCKSGLTNAGCCKRGSLVFHVFFFPISSCDFSYVPAMWKTAMT